MSADGDSKVTEKGIQIARSSFARSTGQSQKTIQEHKQLDEKSELLVRLKMNLASITEETDKVKNELGDIKRVYAVRWAGEAHESWWVFAVDSVIDFITLTLLINTRFTKWLNHLAWFLTPKTFGQVFLHCILVPLLRFTKTFPIATNKQIIDTALKLKFSNKTKASKIKLFFQFTAKKLHILF